MLSATKLAKWHQRNTAMPVPLSETHMAGRPKRTDHRPAPSFWAEHLVLLCQNFSMSILSRDWRDAVEPELGALA
jgi:hypothetical protein